MGQPDGHVTPKYRRSFAGRPLPSGPARSFPAEALQLSAPQPNNRPVRIALRERLVPVLALGLRRGVRAGRRDRRHRRPARCQVDSRIHFYAVGVTALAAAAAAVALTIVGARFSDTRTVLVGTAFAVMAALLALHGLATPGFLVRARTAWSR